MCVWKGVIEQYEILSSECEKTNLTAVSYIPFEQQIHQNRCHSLSFPLQLARSRDLGQYNCERYPATNKDHAALKSYHSYLRKDSYLSLLRTIAKIIQTSETVDQWINIINTIKETSTYKKNVIKQ